MPAPSEQDAAVRRRGSARLFLRAALFAEHAIFLAAGWYGLWAAQEWDSQVALARRVAAGLFTVAVGISFLAALSLAALLLRLKLPLWIVAPVSGALGPPIGAAGLMLLVRFA